MQVSDSQHNVPPFPAFPSVTRYVPTGSVETAMERVCRSVEAQEAVSLVMGPPGTGKSLICGLLAERFRDARHVVVIGETPIDSAASLLRHLLHHLGASFASAPDRDLHLALVDLICGDDAPEEGLLLIVDEAQSLGCEVLEAIRMVTNIMQNGQPRVSAVLCGGVKLDEVLIDSSLEALAQRVSTRCYLHPLNSGETRHYITETIRNCGADPEETITDEAISAIHHATSGVPRLVNHLMTHTIDCAGEADQVLITDSVVDRAWSTLQQLPSPMVEEARIPLPESSIEFGELDSSHECSNNESHDSIHSQHADESPGDCCGDHEIACDHASDGVQVETPTASWIEEPTPAAIAEILPTAPPASALFGDFEVEEELEVGQGVQSRAERIETAPPVDLERMLHQEIVGVSTYEEEPAAEWVEEDCEEIPANEISGEASEGDSFMHLSVVNNDVEESSNDSNDIWIEHDDSDLLVIEDEIDLTHDDSPVRRESGPHAIAIDYHSMLTRMRTGS